MDEKIIDIIDMDLSGRGIGRDNGKAVFIPDAVTGDKVEYSIEVSKKRYDIGRIIKIINPSPNRHDAECDVFGKCGGCTFLHISRDLELEVKRRGVESAFRRAGMGYVKVSHILSGNSKKYRNKVIFHRNGDKYGLYASGSHECCDIASCLLLPDIFNDIVRYTEKYHFLNKIALMPESIMLRIGSDGDIMISCQVNKFGDCSDFYATLQKDFPQVTSAYECIGYPTSRETHFKCSAGKKYITTDFSGVKLRISPASFFQINTEMAEMLCREICNALAPAADAHILDLYCGIGTIALSAAKKFSNSKIVGVEINPSAVEDAKQNCILSDIDNAEFICADAGRMDLSDKPPYAIIVDPPRYGLTDSMIKTIITLKPDKLIYMSCDPGTLAGNAVKLTNSGYIVKSCIAADMFPGCPHVEALCVFEKNG